MTGRKNLIQFLLIIALFLTLEMVSIVLIQKNSIIQRYQISLFFHGVKSYFWKQNESIVQFFRLRKINEELVEDNARLHQTINRYQELLEHRNEEILSVSNHYISDSIFMAESGDKFTYLPATIIKNSFSNQNNYLTINKGRKDGVQEDMGVISNRGIIGIVHAVGEKYSIILSFLNHDQNISASIKSSNTFGPLSWSGISVDKAILKEIPLHTKFSIGDTIITSGLSALYPSNIPIGTIESSKVVDGIYNELTIQMFENYKSLSNVYVVKHRDRVILERLETEK